MIYRFRVGQPISSETQRIVLAEIDGTVATLGRSSDVNVAVHDARKALKRVRAVFRIVRPALASGRFKVIDRQVRNVARSMSQSRDQFVVKATLAAIENRDGVEPGAYRAALTDLVGYEAPGTAVVDGVNEASGRAALALSELRGGVHDLLQVDIARADVIAGFRQGFEVARTQMALAYAARDEEPVHDWRKCVQRHWRHLQLLDRVAPAEVVARVSVARRISVLIGEYQDLSVLKWFVRAGDAKRRNQRMALAVLTAASARQSELLALARPLGDEIFADKPTHLTRRVAYSWAEAEIAFASERAASNGERDGA